MLKKAFESFDGHEIDRVVIGMLQEHEDRYNASSCITEAFDRPVEFVFIEEDTRGPADTLHRVIDRAEIDGPVFSKDSDSWFNVPSLPSNNVVAVADLAENRDTMNVAAKSFVMFDENGFITSIVEKQVRSNFFSAGGYGFADARAYFDTYRELAEEFDRGEIFVSHVIELAIMKGDIFHVAPISGLVDAGTIQEWRRFQNRHQTLFVNLDRVVITPASHFPNADPEQSYAIIQQNVEHLSRLQDQGAQIVYFSSRNETERDRLSAFLSDHDLAVHALILGCNRSRSVLVEPFFEESPYPASIAVNMPGDSDDLESFMPGT